MKYGHLLRRATVINNIVMAALEKPSSVDMPKPSSATQIIVQIDADGK